MSKVTSGTYKKYLDDAEIGRLVSLLAFVPRGNLAAKASLTSTTSGSLYGGFGFNFDNTKDNGVF